MPEGSPSLEWYAYEHEYFERGADWFWALGIVSVSIAVTAVMLHNSLFGLLILIAAVTIALISRHPPELSHIQISHRGIRINAVLHRWDHIISFWVDDETASPMLLIDTTKFLSPNLIIPLNDVDPLEVREFMKAFAEEKHMQEPLSHKILDFFGL